MQEVLADIVLLEQVLIAGLLAQPEMEVELAAPAVSFHMAEEELSPIQ
jgi:hypothetical protein